jgi:acetyl esterase/lipase
MQGDKFAVPEGSISLVDPELVSFLAQFPDFTMTAETLAEKRELLMQMATGEPNSRIPVDRSEVNLKSLFGDHSIRAYLYRPQALSDGRSGLLDIHGGGFVAGHPLMSDAINREIAYQLDCCVLSVDYRRPPETRHPGPIQDCYSALRWFFVNAHALGIDPARIALKGDSAGGGLAASLALLNRDRGEIPLIFQLLCYPMLDDRTGSVRAPNPLTGEFIWTPESNRFAWASLLGRPAGGDDTPYTASPSRAPSLKGLPPTFIAVGQLDLFVEENMDYASRLVRDGVPVELHVYPGAYHLFDTLPGSEIAEACRQSSRAALRRAFARAGRT